MNVDFPTPGTPLMPMRRDCAGVRQQRGQQLIGLRAVIGAGGFEQGDGFRDGAASCHARA